MTIKLKEDPKAVKDLIRTEWTPEDYTITGLTNLSALDGASLFTAKENGNLLGCCSLFIHDDNSVQLSIFVRQLFRGRGHGREMTEALHALSRTLGATSAWSPVKTRNVIMNRMLDGLGLDTKPYEPGVTIRTMDLKKGRYNAQRKRLLEEPHYNERQE